MTNVFKKIHLFSGSSCAVRLSQLVISKKPKKSCKFSYRLEFSHIEYDAWTVCLSPLLAVAQGLHLLLLKRAQQTFYGAFQSAGCCGHCGGAGTDSELLFQVWFFKVLKIKFSEIFPIFSTFFQRFCLCYLLALCPLLAGPALVSFLQSKVPYDASWESIDLVGDFQGF